MSKVKKLYFDADVEVGTGASAGQSFFNCTRVTAGTPASDRYGNFLDALAALTGGSPLGLKNRNTISAVFSPVNEPEQPFIRDGIWPMLDFVAAAPAVLTFGDPGLPFQIPGGGTDLSKAGYDAIYTRNFRVRMRVRLGVVAPSTMHVRGIIYVQRQHSIEV